MPKYIAAARIQASVGALADTKGKATLLDFLIVKRTLKLKAQPSVAITQGESAYIQATREIAAVADKQKIEVEAEQEIFNVFASLDTKKGFRSGKYISNGTGTTIGGNKWQAVLELSQEKPRKASLRKGYETHLADLLLKEDSRVKKPNLADVAIWNYRRSDIEAIISTEPDPAKRGRRLRDRFVADYGLTSAEITALFDDSPSSIGDEDLVSTAEPPERYLAALLQPAIVDPVGPGSGVCSLDLVVALAAKPFAILTGTSGTGKSRATLTLAEQLQTIYGSTLNGQIFQLVAVGPDWTSPKKLLGYRTPFGQERTRPGGAKTNESYEITEALRIILRACHPLATKVPHFLVFDEMNLSHVERYFAPFLSLMEASSILEDEENAPIVDRQSLAVISELLELEDKDSPEAESAALLVKNDQALRLPPNLFYVGTVNVDETTYMFSPKVLDRAHVLEIKALMPSEYVSGTDTESQTIAIDHANALLREAIDVREGADLSNSDPSKIVDALADKHDCDLAELENWKKFTIQVLDGCFRLLAPVGFEFGYRVVKEVYGYMYVWVRAQMSLGLPPHDALATWLDGLDRAILQKVLPKIHGNRTALGESLKALAAFLDGKTSTDNPAAAYSLGPEISASIDKSLAIILPAGKHFTRSIAKLADMNTRLLSRNHVSFVR